MGAWGVSNQGFHDPLQALQALVIKPQNAEMALDMVLSFGAVERNLSTCVRDSSVTYWLIDDD
jgi:hypothetical protein